MKKQYLQFGKRSGICFFLDTMDYVCSTIFRLSLIITFTELCAICSCIYFEIKEGGTPIFEIYIPMIEQVLLFAVLTAFFAFLFDSILRRAKE